MARSTDNDRNRKQRARQQMLRDADRRAKRPNRDDIARTALFMTISSMAARGAQDVLEDYQERIVKMLVQQGFDEHGAVEVLDELVTKYQTGAWPFRRKVHLLYPNGPEHVD